MAKISVIIPAYNAETTLRTAVESILSQQVPELEIIIVNDGSTDGTDRLCHALASEYPCIHVITQKNAGICAAATAAWRPRAGSTSPSVTMTTCSGRERCACFCRRQRTPAPTLCAAAMSCCAQRRTVPLPSSRTLPGSPCTIALGRGGSYGAFLENSGPQFVWNALYRRTALLGAALQ